MRRRERADSADNADSLTAEQAAAELGVSARTVQRYITAGALSGTQRPCRTTRAALRAYQARQEGLAGRIGPQSDVVADSADTAARDARTCAERVGTDTQRGAACVPLAFVERVLADLRHLEREVGRLEVEVEVAQKRGHRGARAQRGEGSRPTHGHTAQVAGALARLVPWLGSRRAPWN